MEKIEATTGFLGFESISDFWQSLVGGKNWMINGIFSAIGGITSFITSYMWDSPNAVWTLWILMTGDWISGVAKAMIRKRWTSFKMFRMPLYFVATSFVLSMSWWMAKGNIAFTLLPGVVMFGFYSVYFTSMLENLGEIGLLPPVFVNVLKNRFGLRALIKKYFSDGTN